MGDRYELDLHCAYCNELNYDVWYAPTCNSYTFKCTHCKKINFIKDFLAMPIEEITGKDLLDAFMDATNVCWSDSDITDIEEECYKQAEKLRKSNERIMS